ncbi:ThiF family adenylyltransferase [Streptacidiphilus cavernicola]|uniref:ThiF family adenylyltransferase n=1 Tax=Streptacidiphilus cavernicola TaxID=3342716 RepID=A0ABV6W6C4_9ACTN
MSPRLTSRSPDLRRLLEEGYDVAVVGGLLVLRHVPYVAQDRSVRFGTLASELTLAGDVTTVPESHVVKWCGSEPCDREGRPLERVINGPVAETLADGTAVQWLFSSKPVGRPYADYHEKMTTYANAVSSPAHALDPQASALTFPVTETSQEDGSVFRYLDTASSRAGIEAVTARLEGQRVAIVGLGGTGSYILDLVAKTPVGEIHLFDGDRFLQHNAFRAPGAASLEDLQGAPRKVDHFAAVYGRMRHGVVAHDGYVDASNVEELRGMDFVFLSLDQGAARRLLVEQLQEYGIAFVDVGMGVYESGGALAGLVRVTTSVPGQRHGHQGRIPFADGRADNEYATNIQIAELNALNAALAVIKWKKTCGLFADLEGERHSVYQIDGNVLSNEDHG